MHLLWAIAWRNVFRHKLRSVLTAGGMAVGIAMCMTMFAWVDGFTATITDIIVERTVGHVQLTHPDYPGRREQFDTVPNADALLTSLEGVEGYKAATSRLYGFALLGGAQTSAGAQLIGLVPDREEEVLHFSKLVKQGERLSSEAKQEILLGEGLAKTLEAEVGTELVAMTQASDGSIGNELYTVTGIVVTGSTAQDRGGAWLHLDDLQQLVQMQGEVHEITLLSTSPDQDDISAFAAAVAEVGGDSGLVRPWWQVRPELYDMITGQDGAKYFFLVIVMFAAAFAMVNTLLMSVFERTREFGVLRALGLTPLQLIALVVFEGLALATLAGVMGLALGGIMGGYLTVYGIEFSAGGEPLTFQGIALDPVMKGDLQLIPSLVITVSAYVVALLASAWPAWRVARLDPITAIRTEA